MDAKQAEVRVLEAEVKALKRALEELPASGEDTARIQYVALLRPRGAGGSVSFRVCSPPRGRSRSAEHGRDAESAITGRLRSCQLMWLLFRVLMLSQV